MAQKISFNDALDYIFVANDRSPNTYLISSLVPSAPAPYSASVSVPVAASTSHRDVSRRVANASSATAALTAATVTATTTIMSSGGTMDAASWIPAEDLYGGVAVGLGGLLINDNGTEFLADLANGTELLTNGTVSANATTGAEDLPELIRMAATSIVLGLMILITIIGNVFVIAAIILERNLQNVANYLVASLAVADLFVACLVMPLGAVYEISQGWILGPELCDIWTSCDVLCCTASILHLVAIAVDRYWAVTNIDYIHSRTSKRVLMMIFSVWSAAVIVSLAPQFGWKDPDYLQRIEQQKCMVSQDVAYQVFATFCTFYLPLLVILVLYWKIYQTARKRIHRRRPRPIDVSANNNQPNSSARKKRKRLRLRIGHFADTKVKANTALGLVEGNSTNTVNTVEDTEFSSSNVDNRSRAGVEVATTALSRSEEIPTTSTSQISTVSHLVAIANQQHAAATKSQPQRQSHPQPHPQPQPQSQPQPPSPAPETAQCAAPVMNASAALAPTPTATAAPTMRVSPVTQIEQIGNPSAVAAASCKANNPTTNAAGVEVLEDPHLQQQLQQMQQQQQQQEEGAATATSVVRSGAACASNATTITSISGLSPQTPTTIAASTPTVATPSTATHCVPLPSAADTHPLSTSANASCQVTPMPRTKNPDSASTASTAAAAAAVGVVHQQQQQQQQQQYQHQHQHQHHHHHVASISNPLQKVTKRKETLEAKRERKAAKTLAIITGAFVVCWLPFFVTALTLPLCEACQLNDSVASLFLWLGYFNSTLNPVIYTIFSPEFRQAFKRILFGGHRPLHYRTGKI